MLPSQFKRLIETLRVHLGAIQEAVKKETDSAKDEQATERKEDPDTVGALRSISDKLETGNQQSKASSEQGSRQQQQLINGQNRLVFWAALAFFAAFVYGAVAFWQGFLTYRTFSEVQKQTTINERLLTEAQNSLDTEQSHFDRGMKESLVQTAAARKSAQAAKSAADTARTSLRLSQAAYLFATNPIITPGTAAVPATPTSPAVQPTPIGIQLSVINSGHMVATGVKYTVYIETVTLAGTLVEGHWNQFTGPDVPVTTIGASLSGINLATHKAYNDLINKGEQAVNFAGTIEFGNGFPESGTQTVGFCWHTLFQMDTKAMRLVPCDPSPAFIEALKKDIGYPKNYEESYK